jgi:hypothetical protein
MRRRDLLCRLAAALAAAAVAAWPGSASRAEPATVASAVPSDVTQPGWQVIGSARTEARVDEETIAIGAGSGRYRALMVRVIDHDLQVVGLRIMFSGGTSQDLPFSGLLRAGSHSGVLGLPNDTRAIARVDVAYRAHRQRSARATIELLGLR